MIALKAIYEDGRIRLLEPAPPVQEAAAVVVFLDRRRKQPTRLRMSWKTRSLPIIVSTLLC